MIQSCNNVRNVYILFVHFIWTRTHTHIKNESETKQMKSFILLQSPQMIQG